MSAQRLRQLGLAVREEGGGLVGELLLEDAPLVNPISQAPLERLSFRLSAEGDVLRAVAPPAVRGLPPLQLAELESAEALVTRVRESFGHLEGTLEARSAELQGLGLAPEVNPETLELRARVPAPPYTFLVAMDGQGHFRLMAAFRDGDVLPMQTEPRFELSEFRDRGGLGGYLAELVTTATEAPAASAPAPAVAAPVHYGELTRAFGGAALVPPRSPLELLVEVEVKGARYRFAAARVLGRTFRGLLAGARGKLWAERFELDDFPGVIPLVAQVLGVPQAAVRVLGTEEQ